MDIGTLAIVLSFGWNVAARDGIHSMGKPCSFYYEAYLTHAFTRFKGRSARGQDSLAGECPSIAGDAPGATGAFPWISDGARSAFHYWCRRRMATIGDRPGSKRGGLDY